MNVRAASGGLCCEDALTCTEVSQPVTHSRIQWYLGKGTRPTAAAGAFLRTANKQVNRACSNFSSGSVQRDEVQWDTPRG